MPKDYKNISFRISRTNMTKHMIMRAVAHITIPPCFCVLSACKPKAPNIALLYNPKAKRKKKRRKKKEKKKREREEGRKKGPSAAALAPPPQWLQQSECCGLFDQQWCPGLSLELINPS